MKNKNYYYIKATDIIMKITTGLLISDIPLAIIPLLYLGFIFDIFNHFDYTFPMSTFLIKALLFFVIFCTVYIILEFKVSKCITLPDKRKIYFIYSIIKLTQSAILFFWLLKRILNLDIRIENLLYFIFFIIHAFILALSIISFVLCLMFSDKDTIENND